MYGLNSQVAINIYIYTYIRVHVCIQVCTRHVHIYTHTYIRVYVCLNPQVAINRQRVARVLQHAADDLLAQASRAKYKKSLEEDIRTYVQVCVYVSVYIYVCVCCS